MKRSLTGYFSEANPGSNSTRRQVLRGALFGFLAFIVFCAAYISWRSLFQLEPLTTVIWALAGMAGLGGIWRLVLAEREREERRADDGFGASSSQK